MLWRKETAYTPAQPRRKKQKDKTKKTQHNEQQTLTNTTAQEYPKRGGSDLRAGQHRGQVEKQRMGTSLRKRVQWDENETRSRSYKTQRKESGRKNPRQKPPPPATARKGGERITKQTNTEEEKMTRRESGEANRV